MNEEKLYKVILGPVVSEKTAIAAEDNNQVVFKVLKSANKAEISAAVAKLFKVEVEGVRVLNVKGKSRRTRFGVGKRNDWKKAYVRLAEGHEIDFTTAE